jgi:hypothetical protein
MRPASLPGLAPAVPDGYNDTGTVRHRMPVE